ncbi:Ccs1/ResB-related putative cytochrome C-type biogenesis protein [Streptomyces lividans 1326]|uniref:Ccs1/ResB-related putative cytochrome C-type biogenesis protein n=1 Tax=Streptomyces lividans 1326 TaxID=1200984 RepID=A0A7U9DQ96_STRLI|nr:Ccs1/ResB-related putative cytochrome C-type biogenesis protein [Streptomyces lividans 1326]KKD12284.1 cytochrome C biogenesis protein [Streptomyces sp. WM6391]
MPCSATGVLCHTRRVTAKRIRSSASAVTQEEGRGESSLGSAPDELRADEAPTAQGASVGGPRLGPVGWLRWLWRSLTSMRTALVLLLLLALAAVPGSLVPQQDRQPAQAADFRRNNPDLSNVLDTLGVFDVFATPWFAAVYLLLFVSLAGCLVPRCRQYLRTLRAHPPAAPRVLSRLPGHVHWIAPAATADEALRAAADVLRGRRFRVAAGPGGDGWVAAEKGYLREAGNLVFHLALFGMLIASAIGSLFSTTGQKLILQGGGFTNTSTQYDDFTPGTLATGDDLEPFSFRFKSFHAAYQPTGPHRGTASAFEARISYTAAEGATPRDARVRVNEPLEVNGTKVFLVSHGYAPVVTVRDGKGDVAWKGPVAFLPQDNNLRSVGVVKAPDAVDAQGRPDQLGFTGLFLPTVQLDANGWVSTFPAPDDPVLVLTAYHGDLGMNSGIPQNVYQLDTERATQFRNADGTPYAKALRPGDKMTLPDGAGSLSFDGIQQWAGFQIARDPSNGTALWSSVAMGAGLCASLFVRRRRVWVRVRPRTGTDTGSGVEIEVAGLEPGSSDRLGEEVGEIAAELRVRTLELCHDTSDYRPEERL